MGVTVCVTEVDMVDPDGRTVEHGTCIVEIEHDAGMTSFRAHSFMSSARPGEDWLLPPQHAFVFGAI